MPEFAKITKAMLVHGTTRQAIETCSIPAGTEYEILDPYTDQLGFKWLRIKAKDGYLYDIQFKVED